MSVGTLCSTYLSPNFRCRSSTCVMLKTFLGVTTSTVMALKNSHLTILVADKDVARIESWNSEIPPFYEPDLAGAVKKVRGRNLFFSSNIESVIERCEIVFIAVGTRLRGSGKRSTRPDLCDFEAVADQIVRTCSSSLIASAENRCSKIIVEKSTVPCGVAENLRDLVSAGETYPLQRHC